jgi:hypothetical protein
MCTTTYLSPSNDGGNLMGRTRPALVGVHVRRKARARWEALTADRPVRLQQHHLPSCAEILAPQYRKQ